MTNWEREVQSYNSQRAEQRRQEQLTARMTAEQQRSEARSRHLRRYTEEVLPQFEILDQLDVCTSLQEIRDQIWGCGQVIKEPTKDPETSHEHNATYILKSPPFYRSGDGEQAGFFYKYTQYIEVSTDAREIIIESNMGKFPKPKIELRTSDHQSRKMWLKQQLTIGCTFDQSKFRHPIESWVLRERYALEWLHDQYPETKRL